VTDYEPVNVPLRKPPHEASDREQQVYFEWFVNAIPHRIDQLAKLVGATPEYRGWLPDRTPDSLRILGAWLDAIVKTPDLLEIENGLKKKLDILLFQIPYKMWPLLPVLAHSATFDTGIYLGEVFRHNFANVEWWLCKKVDEKGQLFLDYGEPVLINFGRVSYMNPVRIVRTAVTLSLSTDPVYDGPLRLSPSRLHELFEHWRQYIPIEDWR
jgi:hypothetical protein